MQTEDVMRRFAATMDEQDWQGLSALLAPGFSARLLHTGETFDADGYVAFNRDYPGGWRVLAEDVVTDADRGALRARVTDGDETFHVAFFATVAGGLLAATDEVWTESVTPHPDRRTP